MNASDTLSAELQRRRQAFDATSREMARLESDRVMTEQAVRVAAGSAADQAGIKLGEIQTAIAKHREDLSTHIDAIGAAARDIVVTKGSALLRATSADYQRAKADFDNSLRALATAVGGDNA